MAYTIFDSGWGWSVDSKEHPQFKQYSFKGKQSEAEKTFLKWVNYSKAKKQEFHQNWLKS